MGRWEENIDFAKISLGYEWKIFRTQLTVYNKIYPDRNLYKKFKNGPTFTATHTYRYKTKNINDF